MKKDAFVEKYHHLIAGMILDAATAQRSGTDLSLWLRLVMSKVDSMLNQAHHDATRPEDPIGTNGKIAGKIPVSPS